MIPPRSRLALALSFLCTPVWLSAADLRIDFNDDDDAASTTQSGWMALTAAGGSDAGGTGIALTIVPVGAGVFLDDRVRSTNGGGSEPDLWEDFLFANGSDQPTDGMDLRMSGLLPSRTYPVSLWMFDKGSPAVRSSTWNGISYSFNGSDPPPASLSDSSLVIQVTSDATGAATIEGRAIANGQPHHVFLNGLMIGDPLPPSTAPAELSLSTVPFGPDAALNSLAGLLTTSDPETGDNHHYTLVTGPGSTHNLLFTLGGLDGEELRTAASLAAYAGEHLSIRVRTTDQHGDFLEKILAVPVTGDSDDDGLEDKWELRYFPDLTTATGAGHNDGDTLTNAEEQSRGTHPILTDTDGDSLPDHLENNSRVFLGAADPGSSPVLADTDGDGIRDDAEFSLADGYITNPNASDTDGDGFPDPTEISAGKDPANPADFPDTLLPLRLTEVLALNRNGLKDGFGGSSDWIEMYNPNPVAVNLDAWYLTDDPEVPKRWNFPAASIPAGGYLVVFASALDTTDLQGRIHTNFGLDGNGGYLALIRPDGRPEAEFAPGYPEQFTDVSYGSHPTDGTQRFFGTPTPGAANNSGFDGVVADTSFSVTRGFHEAPFILAITTATPDASIRYTTDGSKPTAATGLPYSAPLSISGTTTVRAVAFRPGWLATKVDTNTYLFLDQVMNQSSNPSYPPGLPATWGVDGEINSNDGTGTGIRPSDYAMDPRVSAGAQPGYSLREALLAIPSINLSLPVSDMFGPGTGIWTNPAQRGPAWEKECSVEMIQPDGRTGKSAFQENCIVELHGNSSRRPWRMQKHSLRLTFRSTVGPGSLDYDLFPESKVKTFNKLVLRACFTDSWGLVSWDPGRYRPNDSQYTRDFWMKEIYRRMGQPSSYGAYSHLYVNGLYMGLYNHCERLEDDFYSSHFGGENAGWEINADFSNPGPRWNAMLALSDYAAFPAYLDLPNFADYVLLHAFAETEDWPHHNGYAATNPSLGFPFRFFVWDQEIALDNHTMVRLDGNTSSETTGGGALIQKLRGFPEFRLLMADRARKHLFNDGALTASAAAQEYLKVAGRIDQAIVAESARWGDTRSSLPYGSTITQPTPLTDPDHLSWPPAPNTPVYFTREQSWVKERDNIVNNHLPGLHDPSKPYNILTRLRAVGFYPSASANAPDFSQHGGVVPPDYALAITSTSSGTIYYTLDGSDPREVITGNAPGTPYGGPVPLTRTAVVKARLRSPANEWSALTEARFIVGTPAGPGNLVISKIHFHPVLPEEPEYVELLNISAGPIDLTGLSFTTGIEYTFPTGTVLEAGQRLVVTGQQFTGKLDNSGETLALSNESGTDLFRFRYDDDAPWPGSTDGGGKALVLIAPLRNPDPADPANWRASIPMGGDPGVDDAVLFSGDPTADLDQDGVSALLEYALGSSDTSASPQSLPVAGREIFPTPTGPAEFLTITAHHGPATDSASFTGEFSTPLSGWEPGILVRRRSDGTETWRAPEPMTGKRQFMRIKAVMR